MSETCGKTMHFLNNASCKMFWTRRPSSVAKQQQFGNWQRHSLLKRLTVSCSRIDYPICCHGNEPIWRHFFYAYHRPCWFLHLKLCLIFGGEVVLHQWRRQQSAAEMFGAVKSPWLVTSGETPCGYVRHCTSKNNTGGKVILIRFVVLGGQWLGHRSQSGSPQLRDPWPLRDPHQNHGQV